MALTIALTIQFTIIAASDKSIKYSISLDFYFSSYNVKRRPKHYRDSSKFQPVTTFAPKQKTTKNKKIEGYEYIPTLGKIHDIDAIYRSLNVKVPRLLEACKELNLGRETTVAFLRDKNYPITSNPASKLSFEMYIDLIKTFAPEKLKAFEIDDTNDKTNFLETSLVLSFKNGRCVLQQMSSDGSAVIAHGVSTKDGIFFPFFTSTTMAISELEELINDPNVSEDQLQKFLERHPELILDTDYKDAIPQARIITQNNSWEADFVLIPHDQTNFCKILELKLPEERIKNREKNGHQQLSVKLYHAIQQIKDYHNAFSSEYTRSKFAKKYGQQICRPDLQLVIGRKGDFQVKENFINFQKDNGVNVMDWDSFLAKQKRRFA